MAARRRGYEDAISTPDKPGSTRPLRPLDASPERLEDLAELTRGNVKHPNPITMLGKALMVLASFSQDGSVTIHRRVVSHVPWAVSIRYRGIQYSAVGTTLADAMQQAEIRLLGLMGQRDRSSE
mgnify:CR=1 FL=1